MILKDDNENGGPRKSAREMRKSKSFTNVIRSSDGQAQKPRKSTSNGVIKSSQPRRNGSKENNNSNDAEWSPVRASRPRVRSSRQLMPRMTLETDEESVVPYLDIIENMSFVDCERRRHRRSPSPPKKGRSDDAIQKSQRSGARDEKQIPTTVFARSSSDPQPVVTRPERQQRKPKERQPFRSTSNDNLIRGKRRPNGPPPKNRSAPSTVSSSRSPNSSVLKKGVSFNDEVDIKQVIPLAVLTNNKPERVWFMEKELNEMLDSAYDIVDEIEKGEDSDLDSSSDEDRPRLTADIRGLEGLLHSVHKERTIAKKHAWKSVFAEQTNQWERGNDKELDDRAISMAYRSKTDKCLVDAIGRAKQDEKEVQSYLKSARFEHLRAMKNGGYRRGRNCKSCLVGSRNNIGGGRHNAATGRSLRIKTIH